MSCNLVSMTNNSDKLHTYEVKMISEFLKNHYPKETMAQNGEIFELCSGFGRLMELYYAHFPYISLCDMNPNFLRNTLSVQGRLMRESGDRDSHIKNLYLMDAQNIEFNRMGSFLLGFGVLGYLCDY